MRLNGGRRGCNGKMERLEKHLCLPWHPSLGKLGWIWKRMWGQLLKKKFRSRYSWVQRGGGPLHGARGGRHRGGRGGILSGCARYFHYFHNFHYFRYFHYFHYFHYLVFLVFLGHLISWMGMFKVFKWNRLAILIPKHM